MGASDYEFLTRWRVQAEIQEVSDILRDATDLKRWWPSVIPVLVEAAVAARGASLGSGP